MGKELVRADLMAQKEYAGLLARSDLLPVSYRGKPQNILVAIGMGEALGLKPIEAINQVNVIKGHPSLSADLMASLIRRAGHKLRVRVQDAPPMVEVQLIRADDPDFVFVCRWDEVKARAAGLWGKGENWLKYPTQMLRARAISEIARMGASDALSGFIYTPEELESVRTTPAVSAVPQITVEVEDISQEPSAPGEGMVERLHDLDETEIEKVRGEQAALNSENLKPREGQ